MYYNRFNRWNILEHIFACFRILHLNQEPRPGHQGKWLRVRPTFMGPWVLAVYSSFAIGGLSHFVINSNAAVATILHLDCTGDCFAYHSESIISAFTCFFLTKFPLGYARVCQRSSNCAEKISNTALELSFCNILWLASGFAARHFAIERNVRWSEDGGWMADLLFWCRPCASEPPSINWTHALPTSRFLAFLGFASPSCLSLARNLRYVMALRLSFEERIAFCLCCLNCIVYLSVCCSGQGSF